MYIEVALIFVTDSLFNCTRNLHRIRA